MALSPEARYDVRLIDQRLRRGFVSAEEYKKHLDALPDDASEADTSKVSCMPTYADRYVKR